ncbi:hypothetical protein Tco_0217315 [Tanacetum coccineum]
MLNRHKSWLVHKQMACGKDFSNPFMVGNLPKIVGFSTHLDSLEKSWLSKIKLFLALASPKANGQKPTCYEYGDQGHYKSDYPELKNRNHENQAEGSEAHGMVYALGGGETDQNPNNIEDEIET